MICLSHIEPRLLTRLSRAGLAQASILLSCISSLLKSFCLADDLVLFGIVLDG